MNNDKVLNFYKHAVKGKSALKDIFAHREEILEHDLKFMQEQINNDTTWLDMGSGDGLIVNPIAPFAKSVMSVEYFPELSASIRGDNVTVITDSILSVTLEDTFTIVSFFDSLSLFNAEELDTVLTKIIPFIAIGGKLIVKNQFGISERVVVAHHSKELEADYYSYFEQIDLFEDTLRKHGLTITERRDIYPETLNRWSNTHSYAVIATKN